VAHAPGCEAFDFDGDGDVDLFDFCGFQNFKGRDCVEQVRQESIGSRHEGTKMIGDLRFKI